MNSKLLLVLRRQRLCFSRGGVRVGLVGSGLSARVCFVLFYLTSHSHTHTYAISLFLFISIQYVLSPALPE